MSSRTTSRATRRRTSSRALADGPSLFDWAAGLTTGPSGPGPVPASPSPPPANGNGAHSASAMTPCLGIGPAYSAAAVAGTNGSPTVATSGPSSDASSPSAALQSSLESRLRARMDGLGSPLFVLTWKHWDMPSGPPICAVRASAPRTSGSACGGSVKGWTTPTAHDATGRSAGQKALVMAGWPTPVVRDGRNSGGDGTNQRDLPRMASGAMSTGSPAETGKPGQLNPGFSRWLMGYPAAWDSCGATAMRSIRTSRRSSSARSSTSKPE